MKNKRPKARRLRGYQTHGHGAKKKWRGAGNRGGRGNAGSGKRGDSRKPTIQTKHILMGKHGFFRQGQHQPHNPITISDVQIMLPLLIEKGFATKAAKGYTVDLTGAGYTKLLATGKATQQMSIKVPKATEKAKEKITTAGGTIGE